MSRTQAKNAEEFIAQQRAGLASNPDCGTSHYNLGVALMGQGKFEEAEKALYDAIENSPGLAEAYVQLGGIRLRAGDAEGCLQFNQRAVKAKPGFSEGWANIGFIHLQNGEPDEAITALTKATAFNFRNLQALTMLANAYLMKGMLKESIDASKKALDLEPAFPLAHNNLGLAYLEGGQNELAVTHFDKAIEGGYDVAPEIMKEIEALR